ncbi:MFS transporter [Streptomyces sp. NPDC002602]|uniref:MFS transporter n=1 Tax=Streptomyces sp. NPDC002602 TaxID=3364654 RepID=UPI003693E29E
MGCLLNSLAFFTMVPFLTLYLSDTTSLSGAMIGALVGSIALIQAVGSLAGGSFTDRYRPTMLLRCGVLIYTVACAALTTARSLPLLVALIALMGISEAIMNPSMKKLLSLASTAMGDGAFRARYAAFSLGAVLGPLLGGLLYQGSRRGLFVASAVLFAGYLLLLQAGKRLLEPLEGAGAGGKQKGSWRHAVRDRTLLRLTAGALVLTFVFAQFESMIPLYLKAERGSDAVGLFSMLFSVHAVLGILLQVPAVRLSKRLHTGRIAAIGSFGFATAFLCFPMMRASCVWLVAAVVAWTVGEALLMPLPDVTVHELAPDEHKGAYFGLAELRYLGFFAGPAVGGALLDGSSSAYFLSMGVASLGILGLLAKPFTTRQEDQGRATPSTK